MRAHSLGYVGIAARDPAAWQSFGPEILGMPLADPLPDGTVRLRMDDRHHRIAINRGDRDRLMYLGWEMVDEAALEDGVEELQRQAISVRWGTDDEAAARAVRRFAWFHDHVGLRHELCYGPVTSPRSFAPTRPSAGFVTGDQGIGHVALAVPDLRAAKQFYRDALGFRLTDEIDIYASMVFLHCNSRHHSLAIGEIAGKRGLLHLMVQLAELDDVGIAYDLCLSRKVPLYRTLGRHTNDRMVSFYLRTPAGFDIEYGWGAVTVSDEAHSATVMKASSIWGHHRDPELGFDALELVDGDPARPLPAGSAQ